MITVQLDHDALALVCMSQTAEQMRNWTRTEDRFIGIHNYVETVTPVRGNRRKPVHAEVEGIMGCRLQRVTKRSYRILIPGGRSAIHSSLD